MDAVTKLTWKTLNVRYKKNFFDHRLKTKKKGAVSVILEVRREQEVLLDYIVFSLYEMDENGGTLLNAAEPSNGIRDQAKNSERMHF